MRTCAGSGGAAAGGQAGQWMGAVAGRHEAVAGHHQAVAGCHEAVAGVMWQ